MTHLLPALKKWDFIGTYNWTLNYHICIIFVFCQRNYGKNWQTFWSELGKQSCLSTMHEMISFLFSAPPIIQFERFSHAFYVPIFVAGVVVVQIFRQIKKFCLVKLAQSFKSDKVSCSRSWHVRWLLLPECLSCYLTEMWGSYSRWLHLVTGYMFRVVLQSQLSQCEPSFIGFTFI